MTITELQRALEDRNLLEVSKRAGVAYSALRKIAAGNDNVSLRTCNRLSIYLFGVNYNGKAANTN